jgi:hypothetical protein
MCRFYFTPINFLRMFTDSFSLTARQAIYRFYNLRWRGPAGLSGCLMYIDGSITDRTICDNFLKSAVVYKRADILTGNVLFRNNYHLCFDGRATVDWTYILRNLTSKTFYVDDEVKVDSCEWYSI